MSVFIARIVVLSTSQRWIPPRPFPLVAGRRNRCIQQRGIAVAPARLQQGSVPATRKPQPGGKRHLTGGVSMVTAADSVHHPHVLRARRPRRALRGSSTASAGRPDGSRRTWEGRRSRAPARGRRPSRRSQGVFTDGTQSSRSLIVVICSGPELVVDEHVRPGVLGCPDAAFAREQTWCAFGSAISSPFVSTGVPEGPRGPIGAASWIFHGRTGTPSLHSPMERCFARVAERVTGSPFDGTRSSAARPRPSSRSSSRRRRPCPAPPRTRRAATTAAGSP